MLKHQRLPEKDRAGTSFMHQKYDFFGIFHENRKVLRSFQLCQSLPRTFDVVGKIAEKKAKTAKIIFNSRENGHFRKRYKIKKFGGILPNLWEKLVSELAKTCAKKQKLDKIVKILVSLNKFENDSLKIQTKREKNWQDGVSTELVV